MAANTQESATAKPTHVKYVGTADVREINAAAWKNVGAEDKLVRWDSSNKHTVPVADLSDAALKYLESDEGFQFVTEK